MAATPPLDETKAMKTVGAVFNWVPLPEALQKAVLDAFDMQATEPVRNFAVLPKELFENTLADIKIGDVLLKPVPRTKVETAFSVAKMAAGISKHPE